MSELLDFTAVLLDIRDERWMDSALCAQVDPDLFFPEQGGNPAPAKRICAKCPVVTPCLEYALAYEDQPGVWEAWGVYGGMGKVERTKLRRARKERSEGAIEGEAA